MHENNTAARFLTGSLVILALALVAIVGVPALLLTVLLPSSSASCTPASGALGVQKVNVPAGLGKLAQELWDTAASHATRTVVSGRGDRVLGRGGYGQ